MSEKHHVQQVDVELVHLFQQLNVSIFLYELIRILDVCVLEEVKQN